MGRVVHFEFFAENPAEAVAFYRELFDWDIQTWGGPFEYWLVGTGPRESPGIDGAIAPPGAVGDQRVVVTVEVSDLDQTLERVERAGGEALTPKAPVPGVGWQAYVTDPSGLVVGLLQPDAAAGRTA
jgi:predicted enzyme related to lactoylglutathione lyase